MKQEQLQQAQNIFFQTDLSKSEIASILGVSRRAIHYWAHDNQWDQIKKSAAHMPSLLAGNCYFIMAKMQQDILSEERREKAPTCEEVNALYKLTLTIGKLQKRSTLNETLEMSTHFMEFVNDQSPEAADLIKPFIVDYITSRAKIQPLQFTPPKRTEEELTRLKEQAAQEAHLDLEDIAHWSQNPVPSSAHDHTSGIPSKPIAAGHPSSPISSNPISTSADTQLFTPAQPLPKNEKHLNRAQRRLLARTKVAA